jgi:catechol 2,3-dioxygenase-like lactoylglutathione lyase family enzyme
MKMNQIIPMLPVKSMAASVEFYRKLGFNVERRQDDWGWARLAFGDCGLMLDQSIGNGPNAARRSVVYLYPDDIMAYHNQMRASGMDIPDLETTFYGMTEFRTHDPDGNQIWIGQDTSAGRSD